MSRYLLTALLVVFTAGGLVAIETEGAQETVAMTSVQKQIVVLGSEKEGEEESLEDCMDEMSSMLKELRKGLKNESLTTERSLELIADIQEEALECKAMNPSIIKELPEDQQAKAVCEYRKQMAGLVIVFLEVEIALLEGDTDAAQALIKKSYGAKKTGHKQFIKDEE